MFQIFKETRIDFMSRGRLSLAISGVVMAIGLILLFVPGLALGVEFTGGTELRLKFAERPDVSQVRSTLSSAGLDSQSVTTIGRADEHEIQIRMATIAEDLDADEQLTRDVVRALGGMSDTGTDLNVVDIESIVNLVARAPGVTDAQALAQAIIDLRREVAIFSSLDELDGVAGMTPEVKSFLASNAELGPIALRSQSYIGPSIGAELQQKAGLAILGSLLGILGYIWVRFQLQWGFAAVVTLAHDTLVTLALFIAFGKEMSLPVVAAFLALVGYSINDTVVVFDRIRENVNKKKSLRFRDAINLAINQTLSRTVITSGLTLAVTLALLIFGGSALNAFAFVLTVGVIIGTYSSIFVASPILLLTRDWFTKRKDGSGAVGAKAAV